MVPAWHQISSILMSAWHHAGISSSADLSRRFKIFTFMTFSYSLYEVYMGRRVVPHVLGWGQMNCVHPSPIYMCVCVGRGRGGDIRCHQIDLLFCARIPCYMRNITRLTFFSVPDSVRSQQISQQILVNSTESGEKSNQKVQQIFTNLVSGPVSRKEKISRPLYQASQDQMIPGKEEK